METLVPAINLQSLRVILDLHQEHSISPKGSTWLSPAFSTGLFPSVKHFTQLWKLQLGSPYPLCGYLSQAATVISLALPVKLIWKTTSTHHTQDVLRQKVSPSTTEAEDQMGPAHRSLGKSLLQLLC